MQLGLWSVARHSLLNNKLACTCGKITSFNQRKSCNGSGNANKCCLKLPFADIYIETGNMKEARKSINAWQEN